MMRNCGMVLPDMAHVHDTQITANTLHCTCMRLRTSIASVSIWNSSTRSQLWKAVVRWRTTAVAETAASEWDLLHTPSICSHPAVPLTTQNIREGQVLYTAGLNGLQTSMR